LKSIYSNLAVINSFGPPLLTGKIYHTCACLRQPVLGGQSRVPQVQVRHSAGKVDKARVLWDLAKELRVSLPWWLIIPILHGKNGRAVHF
jgi:hypothetical protein